MGKSEDWVLAGIESFGGVVILWTNSVPTSIPLQLCQTLHALPDCGSSQIIFNMPCFRSEPTFPIVTDNDLPKDEATISPSCQLEPHEGHLVPTPIGFDP